MAIEYKIALPRSKPILFTGYGAMRDTGPNEPPSDGVTFRITASDRNMKKTVLEKHVTSTDWTPLEADLGAFAGKEIVLRLESDPGPKRNTTCDSCYWGDPMIFAGEKPAFADLEALEKWREKLHELCVRTMKLPASSFSRHVGTGCDHLRLDGELQAVVVMGATAFLDGKIAVGTPEKFVVYDGVRVSIKGQPLGVWPTTIAAGPCVYGNILKTGKSQWTQTITVDGETAKMTYAMAKNGPALQLSVECSRPEWITSIQLGPAGEPVDKLYYGHGYCIKRPKKFTVGADGHRLSTSHIGMDYPCGISVLQASTMFPTSLIVDNEKNLATLDIRPGTTMTLLPGTKGAFDCAVRYRSINPKKPSPGVKTKAGRFAFDIWGGSYKRHLEILQNAVKYGLTDSLFIVHSWQHYGYDNRLPDIWPPNTGSGTLEEMQAALKICEENGILYGLHDNYIDIYPDADGYNLDLVSFEQNGQPRKAWFNRGIQARSYQFRPDKFLPFLNRNLDMMLPHLPQSCYFVDVFSSMPPVDFYDRQGKLHSRAETAKLWGESFDLIRDRLTAVSRDRQKTLSDTEKKEFYAPTISEAGHDALIGHLDGADCQLGRLDNKPNDFVMVVSCDDWERVPWFDAVNHTNFSLHGVGYGNRYAGGLDQLFHGTESDDYIVSEIMTGHAAMVESSSAIRGAVRKYWLLQPTLRELADCEIDSVTFQDGDIHRMKIVWKSQDGKRKTTVFVNRGKTDWAVQPSAGGAGPSYDKFSLPPFGFFVHGPDIMGPDVIAAICRKKNGDIAEFSLCPSGLFVNGQQKPLENLQPVTPGLAANSFKYVGDNKFSANALWKAKTGTSIDYNIFVHLVDETKDNANRNEGIRAVWGVENKMPTTRWNGDVLTPMNVSVPDDVPAGKYRILVGLWNPADGHRARLNAREVDNGRYSIGLLNVERGRDGKVTALSIEEDLANIDEEAYLRERLAPPREPVNFGYGGLRIRTQGAFYVEASAYDDSMMGGPDSIKRLHVTPLPDEPDTEIALSWRNPKTAKITAVDADGKKLRDVPVTAKDDAVVFTTKQGEFRYVVE